MNAVDDDKKTALFYCIQNDLIEEAKVLLTTKLIDTNSLSDVLSRTPLHLATDRADEDTMELLLNYGANPDIQNDGLWYSFMRRLGMYLGTHMPTYHTIEI